LKKNDARYRATRDSGISNCICRENAAFAERCVSHARISAHSSRVRATRRPWGNDWRNFDPSSGKTSLCALCHDCFPCSGDNVFITINGGSRATLQNRCGNCVTPIAGFCVRHMRSDEFLKLENLWATVSSGPRGGTFVRFLLSLSLSLSVSLFPFVFQPRIPVYDTWSIQIKRAVPLLSQYVRKSHDSRAIRRLMQHGAFLEIARSPPPVDNSEP